ncbi:MAG: polysaccharide deacetylase family protein [Cyanobacteria bacterium SZAS-4]|nr:polysaccharide deacetylase family protein [Cyanobacteria bacterium SZAS-4]
MTLMQQAPEFLRGVKTPRTLMLLYHRIADLSSDPQLLAVTPEHFDQHLQVVRRKYRSHKFSALTESGASPKTPANAIVITFDDGYADNLTNALPLLEKHGIPATVFVTTGFVQERKYFWWDELARIILGEHSVPDSLELQLTELRSYSFVGITDWNAQRSAVWNLMCQQDPTQRHQLYREVSHFLRGASEAARASVLANLRDWAGLTVADESSCNALSVEALKRLARSNMIEIGSHTVDHPVLSTLSATAQETELRESKNYLESLLGHEVKGFAYPYGTRADYTAETTALVKTTGYKSACSNIAEAIWAGTDPFQFPRLLVRDCDGTSFEKWLGSWFGED